MDKEVYANIEGYGGYYEITTWGRVRSHHKKTPIFLKFKKHKKNGHITITLNIGGVKTTYMVSRLVASHFIPNPDEKLCVCHKDENQSNNNKYNLFWATRPESAAHGTAYERSRVSCQKPVRQLTSGGDLVKVWSSSESTKQDGHLPSNVTNCCRGKRKHHHGFKWEYA